MIPHWLAYIGQSIGLIPLAWLAIRRERRVVWWLIASAYALGWIADVVAHQWHAVAVMSLVYPVGQAGLIAVALWPAGRARWLVVLLGLAGANIALASHGEPDRLLHALAWGSIVVVAWRRYEAPVLRVALLVTFGLGLLLWLVFVGQRTASDWLAFQAIQALGTLGFCWAASHEHAALGKEMP